MDRLSIKMTNRAHDAENIVRETRAGTTHRANPNQPPALNTILHRRDAVT